jgi:hypothetical protein
MGPPKKLNLSFLQFASTPYFPIYRTTSLCASIQPSENENGIDSPTCGSRTQPCRSIGQAIDNAAVGDTIEVGAGRYGDLDNDDRLDGPGEEHGNLSGGCEVCITKAVTIVSLHGADQTVIVGVGQLEPVVGIFANGVTFGLKDHGFTLVGGGRGLWTHGDDFRGDILTNLRVAGNVAASNGDFGFLGMLGMMLLQRWSTLFRTKWISGASD